MKKAVALLLILSLAFVFCGCSDNSQNTSANVSIVDKYMETADKYIADGDLETAIKVLDEGVEKTGNQALKEKFDTVTKQLEEQKKAEEKLLWSEKYAEYMNNNTSPSQPINDFFLYDMNGDNTPELVFSAGTCEADSRIHFVTMIDKNATEIGEVSFGHTTVCGLEKENALILHYGQMGYEHIEKVVVIDNKIYSTELFDSDYVEEYRSLEAIKMTQYCGGIEKVEWESNPKDNNYEEIKDLLNK